MELRHLRYFVVTAEAQHFTRAAELLGMAQPPLSQQIRQLEQEVGTPLFDRTGRGVVLNDAGHAFLACAQDILQRTQAAVQTAQRAARGEVGELTLGFTESASFNGVVTELIRQYRQQYPDVEMTLSQGDSESLIAQLREGTIDAAFVRPPFALDGGLAFPQLASKQLSFTQLAEEPLMVALPLGHALARRKRLAPKDLTQERFILYSRKSGYGLSADIMAACRQHGLNPLIGQRAPQLSSAVNLVAAGMGVAVVPASLRHLRPDGVVYRPFALDWPRAVLGLAVRGNTPGGRVENLLRLAKGASR
ncbi:LysR family transcriptional regulator [Achromobacter kerstersii]|uniref:LysR family transcriptional regulator n=1 Tax=Achromobacter kerstersii TaxID=1353890 RepID=UPI0006C3197F|nr:LysR family transcriptional regulator [Achromobacter kerstersii]CUJ23316.1 Hca operon transcriptional activator [Achromobacter kerstersii]